LSFRPNNLIHAKITFLKIVSFRVKPFGYCFKVSIGEFFGTDLGENSYPNIKRLNIFSAADLMQKI
jgi:hypothetical protein